MALADLQAQLALLDARIAAYGKEIASYSVEGVTVTRKSLKELLEEREALLKAIAEDPDGSYEIHSTRIPTG